jgi:hypothetical protein
MNPFRKVKLGFCQQGNGSPFLNNCSRGSAPLGVRLENATANPRKNRENTTAIADLALAFS